MNTSYRASRPSNRFAKPNRFNSQSSRPSYRSQGRRKPVGRRIDPSLFVRAAQTPQIQDEYQPTHVFSDFKVNDRLLRAIAGKNFVTPTPIQDQTISLALEGKDVIGIANTGTGKTLAFALPILDKLMSNSRERALVIAPTRELAQQIAVECRWLLDGSYIRQTLLIGGTPLGRQQRELQSLPQLIIGTPGRIQDHIKRKNLSLHDVGTAVLDEVDRMLDMGFVKDVTNILSQLRATKQQLFFSATLDDQVRGLISRFASPEIVTVSVKSTETSQNIHQDVIKYRHSSEKPNLLHDTLLNHVNGKIIIFDDTQRGVERLARDLNDRGFIVDYIHGGKTQGQRTRALGKFKNDEVRILVATDVAARG
ncbi:MAG: DEAD/DEAH box helicase, partial [Patescibacteria group bacterium]